jgi:uncharacterized cupredoxin-like copper-binding protein
LEPTDHVVVNATLSDFAITLDKTSVPAGEVIFQITNTGPSEHEMVVLKTDQQVADFPVKGFEGDPNRFNEDADGLKNVGETGDTPVAAGATDTLTLHLKTGHYAIVCNLPGHYMAGMHQDFTVASGPRDVDTEFGGCASEAGYAWDVIVPFVTCASRSAHDAVINRFV